jgi:sigma-B regulation protein RsbU (phosphoserine phosphatase)
LFPSLRRLRKPVPRFVCFALLAIGLLCARSRSQAQAPPPAFDATQLREPRQLDMTWLVQPGDDPSYASVRLDDSRWAPFDPHQSINTLYGRSRPPIVWYRLHLKVDPADKGLAISEYEIDRAFEIYANGERIMASGSVQPYRPYTLTERVLAPIPARLITSGSLVLALRVHFAPGEWTSANQNPGYYADNLMLGEDNTLYRENWLTVVGQNSMRWLDQSFLIGLGLVALVLLAGQRRQSQYLWIAAVGGLSLLQFPVPFITAFRNIPAAWEIVGDLPRLISPWVWTALYFSFVRLRLGWRWRAFLVFSGLLDFLGALHGLLAFSSSIPFQLIGNLPFVFLLSVVIPFVLAIHWWRGNREAGILLVPAVLFSLYIYAEITLNTLFEFDAWRQTALRGLNIIDHSTIGPFEIPFSYLSSILCTVAFAIIMLQRSTTMSRRQALLESEFEAAQQVQQLLVPEQIGAVPGFAVESVYLPAQQVGGDFFQIVPDGRGGLLAVVGDVAGKGLPAAMLVSVLVGSIRAIAEFTQDPAQVLANLNDRLVGRAGGGFSTALVAHIADDGWVTIANAGHLSPYLDGKEVELPGALPLGVAAAVTYQLTEFVLDAGSRLTFYSDGVVEAQDSRGELLGFERSRELSMQSATEIAAAARNFGQQDDITVLTIDRTAVPAIA